MDPYSAAQPITDRTAGCIVRDSTTATQNKIYGATSSSASSDEQQQQQQRARRSPDRAKRRSSSLLISVPEEADKSMDFERGTSSTGAVWGTARYVGGVDLTGQDDDDEHDEQVEEWLIGEELAREGLYRGSYKRILKLYMLTPLTTLLTFVLLAYFPTVLYPTDPEYPHSPYPYSGYFPYPLPELLTAASLWTFCHFLNEQLISPFFSLIQDRHSSGNRTPTLSTFFLSLTTTFTHTLLSVLLQLSAVVLLLIGPSSKGYSQPTWRDHSFHRVWAIALGWAGIEAVIGIKQGYENLALYRDVLVTVRRVTSPDLHPSQQHRAQWNASREHAISLTPTVLESGIGPGANGKYTGHIDNGVTRSVGREGDDGDDDLTTPRNERQPLLPPAPPPIASSSYELQRNSLAEEVEYDLEQLMALKSREELEEVYGMPVIYIPIFIPPLHRINAVLLSLGNFLLISGAYLRSSFAPSSPRHPPKSPSTTPSFSSSLVSPTSSMHTWIFETTTKSHISTPSDTLFALTLLGVLFFQLVLASLHTSWVLPRIGVHTFVYVSLLVSLGMFFAGLGFWEALV